MRNNFFKLFLIILIVVSLAGCLQRHASKTIGRPALETTIDNLNSPDPDIRLNAIMYLIANNSTHNLNNYSSAVKALGEMKDPRVVDYLIAALNNPNMNVRRNAATMLGMIKDLRAITPLIAALDDSHSWVREDAIFALSKIKDPRVITPLIAALNDSDGSVRGAAGRALRDIKDPRIIKEICFTVKSKPSHARLSGSMAALDYILWEFPHVKKDIDEGVDAECVIYMLKHALSEDFDKRRAAEILGGLKDPRAVEVLIALLNDENLKVRKASTKALGEIKDPHAVEPLIKLLDDSESSIRMEAAWALGEIGDKLAGEALISELYKDKADLQIISGAYRFYIKSGNRLAIPLLVRALGEHGGQVMARDFINCNNSSLSDAGYKWAKSNNYKIMTMYGSLGSVRWGAK
jgi:HEAT repeat protein